MRTAISTSMILLWGILTSCEQPMSDNQSQTAARPAYVLVIHGGAGTIEREKMSADLEKAYRQALNMALDQGEKVLKNGGTAEDAVIASILYMEDDSLFNAGKGAVLNYEGAHELDASIMTGHDLKAGAVTGAKTIKNPILAARAVKDQSDHVLLAGAGADEFAKLKELNNVNNSYFTTEKRRLALDKIQKKDIPQNKTGTVGAVALDRLGNIAAGTSTGGMTNKRWNRIGDSPLIGAGTYAENQSCAISCTGHGEYFIRYAVAYDLAARVKYLGENLEEAARHILFDVLLPAGGTGGLIAIDTTGQFVMPFNTPGMYRGYTKPGKREVAIFGDEGN